MDSLFLVSSGIRHVKIIGTFDFHMVKNLRKYIQWLVRNGVSNTAWCCVSFFFFFFFFCSVYKQDIGNSSYPGPEVIKLFSCSTQLSMEFLLLINFKMTTIVGILTVMSGKNSILGLSEPKKAEFLDIFYTYEHLKFHAQLS